MSQTNQLSSDNLFLEETRKTIFNVELISQLFSTSCSKKICKIIVGNSGYGLRQGLIGLSSGSKGDITILGKTLKQIAVHSAIKFAQMLPINHWLIFIPSDQIIYFHNTDLLSLSYDDLTEADIIVLGIPHMEKLADPKLPSVVAMKKNILEIIQKEMKNCLNFSGIKTNRIKPQYKAIWWSLLIRPALLSFSQWSVASGYKDFEPKIWGRIWSFSKKFADKINFLIVTPDYFSININTNMDIHSIFQSVVVNTTRYSEAESKIIKEIFSLPKYGQSINSTFSGNIFFKGQYLFRNSNISANGDIILQVGDGVVIDDSTLNIFDSSGKTVVIPRGTVISKSNVLGKLSGTGTNGLLYMVKSNNGVHFRASSAQTTLCLYKKRKLIGSIPFDMNIKDNLDTPVIGLGENTINELIKKNVCA